MRCRHPRTRRRGIVLIIVLVVVIVLALAAYTFSDLMIAHRRVSEVNGKRLQARMLVASGVEAVKTYLTQDTATRLEAGGHFNNPQFFQGVVVMPELDPDLRGSFTALAPFLDDVGTLQGGVRYGLEDESARLNLNLVLLADQVQPGASRGLLMGLPGMTEDVADAILDWIDEDEEPRDYGAEFGDYYSTLTPAYEPRNGPLQSVEELLLVRGVTPELLFGADFNRNGVIDPHESTMATGMGLSTAATTTTTAATTTSLADPLGTQNRGWSAYLTLYSGERNATADGLPRIYLNNDDLEALHAELSEVFSAEWANFIVAYRIHGPAQGNNGNGQGEGGGGNGGGGGGGNGGGGQVQTADQLELDLSAQPQASFAQVLDLIGATIQIQPPGQGGNSGGGGGGSSNGGGGDNDGDGGNSGGGNSGGDGGRGDSGGGGGGGRGGSGGGGGENNDDDDDEDTITVNSPFANDPLAMVTYLSTLMDTCTTMEAESIPGRININEAPLEVLLGIPGMTEDMASQIVELRTAATDPEDNSRSHETWLLSEAIVTLDQMRALLPFVCAGGDVFRCQIVGYFQGGGPAARAEVVFDATSDSPRVLSWRDISHLGRGHALETLGVDLVGLAGQ